MSSTRLFANLMYCTIFCSWKKQVNPTCGILLEVKLPQYMEHELSLVSLSLSVNLFITWDALDKVNFSIFQGQISCCFGFSIKNNLFTIISAFPSTGKFYRNVLTCVSIFLCNFVSLSQNFIWLFSLIPTFIRCYIIQRRLTFQLRRLLTLLWYNLNGNFIQQNKKNITDEEN